MITDLKPYPAYKDSGVEWLGEVPEHWDCTRLGNLIHHRTKKFNQSEDTPVLSLTIGGVRVKEHLYAGKSASSYIGHQLVESGELVFTPRDFDQTPILSGVAQTVGCISNLYFVVAPRFGVDIFFVDRYLWGLKYRINYFQQFAEGMRYSFSRHSFNNIPALLPPLPEQAAIVRFLDYMDQRISRYIQAKRKLIKLLEEQKQAIIHKAVTRGLDPDVPLKDSGVEWLGKVPEHWEVVSLKRTCSLLRDGTHLPPSRTADGIPLLSVRNIVAGRFKRRDDDSMISEFDYQQLSRSFTPQESDVLLAIVGATLGKVAVVPHMERFQIQRSLAIFRPKPTKLLYKFLAAYLEGPTFQRALWSTVAFSAQPGIYLNTLGNFAIVLPQLPEQAVIVEYLDQATADIETTITRANREIELLNEYRTRLIADVVTGKLDVSIAADNLPEISVELEGVEGVPFDGGENEDGREEMEVEAS